MSAPTADGREIDLAGREVAENAAKFLMEYPWRPDDVLITPVGH